MQSVSAEFITAATATVRQPIKKFEVWWDPTGAAHDESERVIGFSTDFQASQPGFKLQGQVTPGQMNVMLRNVSFRFSWLKTSGGDTAIRSLISGAGGLRGKKVRMQVGFRYMVDGSPVDEYIDAFNGYIVDWAEGPRSKNVSLTCVGVEERIYQNRLSTTLNGNSGTSSLSPAAWIEWLRATYLGSSVTASLDPSYTVIPYVWMDDETPLDDIHEAATSEGGYAWFDTRGRLIYRNHAMWVNPQYETIRHAFTAYDLDDVSPSWSADALATKVVVEWSTRYPGKSDVLYQAQEPRMIAPGETVRFKARFKQPAFRVEALERERDYWFVSPGGATMNGVNSNNIDICSVSVEAFAQSADITVQNNHPSQIAVMTWLQVRGIPLVGGLDQEAEFRPDNYVAGATPIPYERVRSVRDTLYLQTPTQVHLVGSIFKDRIGSVVPVFTLDNCPALPYLELGDRVSFTDGRTMGVRTGFIFGIHTEFSIRTGLAQSYTVVDDAAMRSGTSPYFIIGTTELGAGVAYY